MAYADDIVCLLTSLADLDRLHSHLSVYSAAFNALVNFHKTEAILLRGSVRDYDLIWHDAISASPIRYLGFPLCTSIAQRSSFLGQLLDKVRVGFSLQPSPSPILAYLLVLATFTLVSQCLIPLPLTIGFLTAIVCMNESWPLRHLAPFVHIRPN
ncbi:hypothetical protein MUCCIDRAFT_109284 [Mucor lusitanicus CBS 277.49]|uniref:Reverse transcriptase domain-containing protein n=1 Tax=Mucor lusitanicus CBS 277.49 TaxID=747725 RepID=A0A168MVJ3_MUCCL|nr:hypothetical protein MUCCIDRAFT_109284 [Mucor lusitanicus CBS 277.49]